MEPTPVIVPFIGKNERELVWDAIQRCGGVCRLAILGKKFFVGSWESTVNWTSILENLLVAEMDEEERIAKNNRRADADRGIPANLTFKMFYIKKELLENFRRSLETARAADEKWRAQQEEAKAAKAAQVATSAPADQPAAEPATGTEG